MWVVCQNGSAQVLPIYTAIEELIVGGTRLELIIKEITEAEEFEAYKSLTLHHYRGQSLCGRTARLIVRSYHPLYPAVIGYVELATPFYMSKPRTRVLNAPFQANGIAWDSWDMATQRQYINLNVRVARCVIAPEFRGLRLGQLLMSHAASFARERWQIARLKPYFLEISADMLKYVPFAEKAGMSFIGETQGNLARVAKDMSYLLRNRTRVIARDIVKEEACGIVDQQVARMNRAASLMERMGWDLEDLVNRLGRSSATMALRDVSLLQEILSLPKPTYVQGLNTEAQLFLQERLKRLMPANGHQAQDRRADRLAGPVELRGVGVGYTSRVRRTSRTHAIEQAFGISPDDFTHQVLSDLNLTLEPREVLLITGASGSGKSTLLRILSEQSPVDLTGSVSFPPNYRPGTFVPIASKKALIDVLGCEDTRAALRLMGLVGLSDAFVYLKRFGELSAGQQYRAMLAKLIASEYNVWLADEFCSNLDPLTANVVADRVQALAREVGATLVVASSNPEVIVRALMPNRVLRLGTAWDRDLISGEDFLRSLNGRPVSYHAPRIAVTDRHLAALRRDGRLPVVTKGRATLSQGLILLESNRGLTELGRLSAIRQLRFSEATDEDARSAGYSSVGALRRAVFRQYPTFKPTGLVTIASVERLPR